MTLQQLTYFLAAANHGSFSAAAETLHMAQPSLSEQVRRLEAELGVSLFVRAGRKLELTEAGHLLLPHAERTLAAAEETMASVREVRTLSGGTVSFGTFGSAHHYLLTGLVQDFRARHPNVRLRILGQNSSEVADAVREGRLEAGLIVLPVDDRGLDVRTTIREEIHYVSADPDRLREPMTIDALARAPLIMHEVRWPTSDPTRRQLVARAQAAGVTIEPQVEVEYLTAALDLAARGLGDTVAPRFVVIGRGYGRRLGSVPFDPPLYDTFAFITRRNAHLSPATRALIAIAERRIDQLAKRLADVGPQIETSQDGA
jgi:LysR family cyn operon transcriptional activator